MSKDVELLQELRDDVANLHYEQKTELDACKRRAEMLIRNILGESSSYLTDLQGISFSPSFWVIGMTDADVMPYWTTGRGKFLNLIDTMMEERTLFRSSQIATSENPDQENEGSLVTRGIFIVHGRDVEMKQSVARVIEKLGLEAVILHEQPNAGRTVIEKFMDFGSVVSFAVVLLSPDDVVLDSDQVPPAHRFRARQNVILEFGFFVGKLGRSRVVVLHRQIRDFEMPSDIAGVLYVPYDERGTWQLELVKELKAAGYDVDANILT
jgi:predicted nucleotide-binding protein